MIAIIIIFVLSLCFVAVQIGSTIYAQNKGTVSLSTRLLSRYDNQVITKQHELYDMYTLEKNRIAHYIRSELPRYALAIVQAVKGGARAGYKSVFPNIRGVRVLRNSRDASEFLQHISLERERDGKGRIEDGPLN